MLRLSGEERIKCSIVSLGNFIHRLFFGSRRQTEELRVKKSQKCLTHFSNFRLSRVRSDRNCALEKALFCSSACRGQIQTSPTSDLEIEIREITGRVGRAFLALMPPSKIEKNWQRKTFLPQSLSKY